MKNRLFPHSCAIQTSSKTLESNARKSSFSFNPLGNLFFLGEIVLSYKKGSLILISIFLSFLVQCNGTRPTTLGVQNGKLGVCPQTPNCVSSFVPESDAEHAIKPLSYKGTPEEGKTKLKTAIGEIARTKIVKEDSNYLYVEFTSLIWRYIDDVEFLFDPNSPLIHVRSASRLGKSDFGVNRKRIETIREKLNSL
ncbi:DUF1499 domain-containing protein [Leptospira stimsonii]|uniref:DUF1499 domain-containing protein n=1 Tax=Leptospira stimsonii TaxID=2202203 RepID=A0ABY2MUJ9_9LEPT|nr:DUF1499 domain-containing protein [Leptospira stimsonii]TGK19660.1 DUF1499 domain-containing protein [Leptospira stimsonii]TGM08416.1 DUF1499 domain-containing protein [Leptospira stimsonii]